MTRIYCAEMVTGKRPRQCRNVVADAGAVCWRHRSIRVTPDKTLRAIDAALRHGADEDVWPCGLTRAEAIVVLIAERAALRVTVARLLALLG